MHGHRTTFHAWLLLDGSNVFQLLSQSLQKILPQLRMRDRSATEEDRQLHLIAGFKEPGRLSTLGCQIVLADFRLDPDLLELDDMLILLGIALFSALLIPKFAIVH